MPRRRASAQAVLPAVNPQEEMIGAIQARVTAWVEDGYPGASDLSRALLDHWFAEPHLRPDGSFFLWYPHQRRAVETAIFLYEVERLRRVEDYAALVGLQRAPQRDHWAKLGLQMATGAGKTKVMSLLMAWAHLHWACDTNPDLGFGNTQLLIAPNLIVLERLLTDFQAGAIFERDPIVPPDLRRDWSLRVVTPENVPGEWRPGEGYLVVTNVHKLYRPPEENGAGEDGSIPQLSLFETAPPTRLDAGAPPLLGFLRQATSPVTVFNDEAHHVHDEQTHYPVVRRKLDADEEEGIAWHKVLLDIDDRSGLALQADLSATLFEESNKAWFRHVVYDYPLSRAIADGVVKQPFLGKVQLRYKDGHDEPIPPNRRGGDQRLGPLRADHPGRHRGVEKGAARPRRTRARAQGDPLRRLRQRQGGGRGRGPPGNVRRPGDGRRALRRQGQRDPHRQEGRPEREGVAEGAGRGDAGRRPR
ncbi:MAG: DEAD/DEAH box helicase family protein [Chloroflexota bacterium]|nr:DEAD/DEAH box helicase family protein [Chloroflexota bacterium]